MISPPKIQNKKVNKIYNHGLQVQNAPEPHQNDRPRQEGPPGNPIFRNFPKAPQIHIRPGLLLENVEE